MKHLLALMIICTTPAMAADRIPVGDWTGLGYQNGDTWPMELQIAQGGARVDYPSSSCGGLWVFDPTASTVRGTEWLTYGKSLCLDALTITVDDPGDGTLMVRWFDQSGTEIAYAPLERAGGSSTRSGGKKSSAGGNE